MSCVCACTCVGMCACGCVGVYACIYIYLCVCLCELLICDNRLRENEAARKIQRFIRQYKTR